MPPKLVTNALKFSKSDSGKTLALLQADRRILHSEPPLRGCSSAMLCSLQTEQTGEPSETGALKSVKTIAMVI